MAGQTYLKNFAKRLFFCKSDLNVGSDNEYVVSASIAVGQDFKASL